MEGIAGEEREGNGGVGGKKKRQQLKNEQISVNRRIMDSRDCRHDEFVAEEKEVPSKPHLQLEGKKRGNVKEGIAGKEGTHQLEHTLLRPKILRKPQQIEKAGKVPTPLLFPAKKIVACSDRRNGAKSLRHQHATSNPHNFPTFSAPSADLDFLPPTDLRNSQTARSRGYRRLWASRRRKRYIAHHPRCHLK